ncbi:hypothetical protein BaRGS_00002713 [Batillaria attramentaria]|uniref:Nuclear pore complex protein Nup88 n=1 Tax=Batillaria attramentaria TaxID=370345 RepID=A0ABD0M2M1_9CAEN
MAAPIADWREKLKVHPLCQRLKEISDKEPQADGSGEAKSLLAVKNGDLFVWDSVSANVVYCNLKHLLSDSSSTETYHFQVLLCTDVPRFEVKGLSLNSCSSHLAIWGPRGVHVLELPQRWGKLSEFEGGKDVINCRTITIGSRYLASSPSLQVHQITWHPGSPCDTHLAVLTSDNVFSVYSLTDSERPVSAACVMPGEMSTVQGSPSKLNISAHLGETAVAFNFGPPQELQAVQRPFQPPQPSDTLTVWPVFLVKGNGDILVTYSDVVSNRPLQLPTQGPLVMCPPAEDNYGVDACSILCLDTSPPVIIMATCDGQLHHCLLLPTTDADGKPKELTPAPGLPRYQHPVQPMLYVLESVELELSLTDASGLDSVSHDLSQDPFTCPIKLMKDPCSTDRYHCCHSAGVHSIALPWVHNLHQFFSDDVCEFVLPEDQDPAAPVLGMDIVSDPTLTPTLLVLSVEYEFTALPMSNKYRSTFSAGLRDASNLESLSSPLRRIAAEPFSQQIAKILHRSQSNPILLTNPKTEMSQQACFQLLTRVTRVLREEYVQKQEHAQQELDTRVRILTEHKVQQLQELRDLEHSKEGLREMAHRLADRLENYKEQEKHTLERLEKIMRKLQSRVPTLSLAEKQMHSELLKLKEKAEEQKKNLAQLRLKQQHQLRQLGQPKSASSPSTHMRPQQLTHIKDILKEEGEEIAALTKQISQLQMETSL